MGGGGRQNARMRFEVEHRFAAPVARVQEALADPAFHRSLRLPDVGPPEVVEHEVGDDGEVRLLVRMVFTGRVDPIVRKLVGGGDLAWLQRTTVRTRGDTGRLEVTAAGHEDRLRAVAEWRCEAAGQGCVRRLAGDLSIRLPLVGGAAEAKVVPGLRRRLDVEAASLGAWLAG